MKIDGPVTNNYTATCQVFDRAGKLLGQQTAVTTRSKVAMMNTMWARTWRKISARPLANCDKCCSGKQRLNVLT